jgi:predicted Zn-dependent peptidase
MYKKIVLKNGLKVIIAPNKSTSAFTALIAFKVGSLDENNDVAGISHFFEHMTYKGSKKRQMPYEVAEFMDSIGGEHNAYTGKEYTAYYVKAASEHLERALDFLSDNILHPLLPDAEIAKEKNVILEEIKTYEDIPSEKVKDLFEQAIFGKSKIGRLIIGNRESVGAISRDKLRTHIDQYYHPKNAVLAIAGNITSDKKEVAGLVNKYFDFKVSDNALNQRKAETIRPKKKITHKQKTEQSNIIVGFSTPGSNSKEWYALKILAKIIGGSMSSRMFVKIREELGLAYYVATSYYDYRDFGYIATRAGVDNEKVALAVENILSEYKKIVNGGINAKEILNAKEMLKGGIAIGSEDSEYLAEGYALTELIDEKIEAPEELIKKYFAVSRKEIEAVARKHVKNFSVAAIGPNVNLINNIKL